MKSGIKKTVVKVKRHEYDPSGRTQSSRPFVVVVVHITFVSIQSRRATLDKEKEEKKEKSNTSECVVLSASFSPQSQSRAGLGCASIFAQ